MNVPRKIMIADDDDGIVDVITLILRYAGYDVKSTTRGEDILAMENNLPDLLLLDIWMSGQDGRKICTQLKQNAATSHMLVILTSASREIEQSALAAGANGFIAKPFEMDDLIAIVKKHLDNSV